MEDAEKIINDVLLAQKLRDWNRSLDKPVIVDSCEYAVAFKMIEIIRDGKQPKGE